MERRTTKGILDFLSHNTIALIALFVALGGTAYAATALPTNSVGTKQIKKSAVTGVKVKDNSITGADVLESSLGKVPSATSADSATSAAPSGAAGGDLSGSYPNPTIASGAVGTSKFGALPAARVRNTTNETTSSGSWTALTFNVADFNVSGVYDAGQTDRLTAPVAGKYLITLNVGWEANAVGVRSVNIFSGGAPVAYETRPAMSDATFAGGQQEVVTMCHLEAGQTVRAYVWQSSGGALYVRGGVTWSPVLTMQWLAP
jgi:hypothetical protein